MSNLKQSIPTKQPPTSEMDGKKSIKPSTPLVVVGSACEPSKKEPASALKPKKAEDAPLLRGKEEKKPEVESARIASAVGNRDLQVKDTLGEDKTMQKPTTKIPIFEEQECREPSKAAVPRTRPPLPAPVFKGRPLVLATHLVPSLPIALFEVLTEAIEAATGQPVVVLHESRPDRPVAEELTNIAILPPGSEWTNGKLLPISFVFKHRLNKSFSPAVYADVVVATDRAPHVEDVLDLRGHRCALPDRRRPIGAARLLFNHLHIKGEGPAFFGNTLDANSQLAALQMVAGKQVEVCILESPVINCHRSSLPGVYSLHILSSLGPLPPYSIFVDKNMSDTVVEKIKTYLLKVHEDSEWIEKFAPYSVIGFAEYSPSLYDRQEMKKVATSAPYY